MVARLDDAPAPARATVIPPARGPEPSPLSSDHFVVLKDARVRGRKVFRAASVASFSGWTTGLFAALTILFGLTDPASLILGIGMGAVAFNEFRGAAMLRRFDLKGPTHLAIGQLALGVLIFGYAAWRLADTVLSRSAAGSGDPQVDAMLADMNVDGVVRAISAAIYAGVAVVGLAVPGLTAVYYRSRARHVREFLAQTPDWAVRALQA